MKVIGDDGTVLVDDVKVLDLAPTDVLVVRYSQRLPNSAMEQMKDQLHRVFPVNQVLIFEECAEIGVIHAPEVT